MELIALFRLGFPTAPRLRSLNLAAPKNSPDHSSISTPSPFIRRALTVCRLTVSGLFTPLSGCFSPFPHGTGSLSVAWSISPWRVVPPASHGIPRAPWYSGTLRAGVQPSPTGLSPSLAAHSRVFRLTEPLRPGTSETVPRVPHNPAQT